MKILSWDPGVRNFAWACINSKCKILGLGTLKHPIKEFNNPKLTRSFRKEVNRLIVKYKPDYIVAERFQNRGRVKGSQGEFVSYMLGHIDSLLENNNLETVSAMTWKSYYRRVYLSEELIKKVLRGKYLRRRKKSKRRIRYKFEIEHLLTTKKISEHEKDALGISLWKLEILKGKSGYLKRIRRNLKWF